MKSSVRLIPATLRSHTTTLCLFTPGCAVFKGYSKRKGATVPLQSTGFCPHSRPDRYGACALLPCGMGSISEVATVVCGRGLVSAVAQGAVESLEHAPGRLLVRPSGMGRPGAIYPERVGGEPSLSVGESGEKEAWARSSCGRSGGRAATNFPDRPHRSIMGISKGDSRTSRATILCMNNYPVSLNKLARI